jgi:aminodeoxyfutalosine deaminase
VQAGFSQVPGVACRVVASITRHAVGLAPPSERRKFANEFFEIVDAFRGDLIVGLDLSGLESNYSAESFKEFFKHASALRLPTTVHAGETEGPEEVWVAIDELGASRIGHGTTAPQDPVLVQELIRRKIALEVCPTAGWLVGTLRSRNRHPVIECEPPLPYVICTDNPTLNASTQSQELAIAAGIAGDELIAFSQSQFDIAAMSCFDPSALASVLATYTHRGSDQLIS